MDSVIVAYVKDKPNSYVAFWIILDRFSKTGFEYNNKYKEALNYFSDEIKGLPIYDKFKEELLKSRDFTFEDFKADFTNLEGDKLTFEVNDLNKKFVLLDFWFSNCKPCLREMPKYIPIYEKYQDFGFEIVSISIDGQDKIQNWRNVIKEKGFVWKNFLDKDGVESFKINITRFPTTFLVDSNGGIIKKDISPDALQKFLEENINTN